MRPATRFFGTGREAALDLLFDPSRSIEVAMVRGILTGHVMEAVSKEMFGGAQGRTIVDETLRQLDSSALPAGTRDTLRDPAAVGAAAQSAVRRRRVAAVVPRLPCPFA